MKNQNVTGIGCFAKPERLGRIFNKLVQNYTLRPIKGNQLFDGHLPKVSDGDELLHVVQGAIKISVLKDPREYPAFICLLRIIN
jgi:hypothetical protein